MNAAKSFLLQERLWGSIILLQNQQSEAE